MGHVCRYHSLDKTGGESIFCIVFEGEKYRLNAYLIQTDTQPWPGFLPYMNPGHAHTVDEDTKAQVRILSVLKWKKWISYSRQVIDTGSLWTEESYWCLRNIPPMVDDGAICETVNCCYNLLTRSSKMLKEAVWFHHISSQLRFQLKISNFRW